MRLRQGPPLALALAAALLAALALPVAVAGAAPAASTARAPMLVFLRATDAGTRGARELVVSDQSDVAALARQYGSAVLARTTVPDTMELSLTSSQSRALARNPMVAQVLPNTEIPGPQNPGAGLLGGPSSLRPGTKAVPSAHASCGTSKKPQLEPEGLSNIDDVNNAVEGFTGKGITVAFLADGLQTNDPDLLRTAAFASKGSPTGSKVIKEYQDFSGDGLVAATDGGEAFGDAASIASQGRVTYDLSKYVSRAHPLPKGCYARIEGTAPGASLLALKVFGSKDLTTGSGFVQAINYAVAHHASVINESFGGNPFPDTSADIIRDADDAAVAAGVTVIAATGDSGSSSTLASPGTDPNVLSVGATTQFRAYAQDSFGGINLPGESGGYIDNNVSAVSSGGFGQDGKTVDLVAPGDIGWSLCSANRHHFTGCDGVNLQLFGGTSEAAPITSGAAADVIEAYEASHRGERPTPAQVMEILTSTARDLGAPADEQGAGLLDVGAAVRLALSMPGSTRADRSGGIVADAIQEDLSGNPRSTVAATISLTNTSTSPAAVGLSTRALVTDGGVGGRLVLDPYAATKTPRFSIWSGALEIYRKVTFTVKKGVAHVDLHAAYQYEGENSFLQAALFDPHGRLASFSLPQGAGDFIDAEVSRPEPGKWTVAFFTSWDGFGGQEGTAGPVPYAIDFYKYAALGSTTRRAITIAPGATVPFTYRATMPAQPGDSDAAIVVRSKQGITTIPVTLRSDVALSASGGSFVGTLLGGNGRTSAPGQTNTYNLVVPSAEPNMEVSVRLTSNPPAPEVQGTQLVALLVDPAGQTEAYDSNYTVNTVSTVVDRALELYVDAPAGGTWQLVLDWVQPGSGVRVALDFRVTIAFGRVSATAPLPDSAATDVSQSGEVFNLTVKNTGVAPLLVSPDARLDETATLTLPDVFDTASTQDLPSASNIYFVPPQTDSLTITENASVEATFDALPFQGDPDISPTSGAPYVTGSLSRTAATLTYAPPTEVTPGMWNVTQAEVGPYPSRGEPRATETTTVSVVTQAFDQEVTSATPDSVESLALGGSVDPMIVNPGGTVVIPLTFTPTATVGSIVTGTLYVDGLTTGSQFGASLQQEPAYTSVITAIPYEYTVSS